MDSKKSFRTLQSVIHLDSLPKRKSLYLLKKTLTDDSNMMMCHDCSNAVYSIEHKYRGDSLMRL